jgi:hypothetical protein
MNTKYYYLIMSQKDMIQNQVLEELLRERTNYYLAKNKKSDFWVSMSPSFIKDLKLDEKILKTNFYIQHKNTINSFTDYNFYSSLISVDKDFINWIHLRLGYFEDLDKILNLKDKGNYVSDGVCGSFDLTDINSSSVLQSNKTLINPDLIIDKYKAVLNMSYSTIN